MVRQPGQAGEGVVNASQPLIYDYTNLTISVLDTIRANATLASKVDLNNVTLMSVALASYGTARACASLPDRLQACVLNSPMYDVAAIIGSAVARLMLSPMALAANSTPNALPSEDMVRWLSVHAVGTAIGTHICVAASVTTTLLTNCSASSGAPQVFGTLFKARGIDPDVVQTVQMAMVRLGEIIHHTEYTALSITRVAACVPWTQSSTPRGQGCAPFCSSPRST
ncbi:MAG: hypothetical protein EBS29_13035 [Chloroflexia bacterium]|nr:hypothetical protein [Chloroflexia bacterium]